MKHLIIGGGVVGKATGLWLESNNEDVTFNDVDTEVLEQLKAEGHRVSQDLTCVVEDVDLFWVCTAEWNVDEVLENLDEVICQEHDYVIVVRSTTPVGTMDRLADRYVGFHLVHLPEFLRASNAVEDMFNPDRVVVGTRSVYALNAVRSFFKTCDVPVLAVKPMASELIKYASNCWLATQISYWNEIRSICKKLGLNPQEIANAVRLDKRISSYGTAMLGSPFKGFCLPKDLDSLIKVYEENDVEPVLLKAVKEVNEK